MSNDVKIRRFVPPDQRQGHSLRDFNRGFQTKHMVKGAAGGARGVDYQDSEAEFMDRLKGPDGAAAKGGAGDKDARAAQEAHQKQAAAEAQQATDTSAAVPSEPVVQAQFQARADKIDVKEDPRKRKFMQQQDNRKDEEQLSDEEVEQKFDTEPGSDAERAHLTALIEKLLADPMMERRAFGALFLTQPEEIRRIMGTPVRTAKHLLVLATRMLKHQKPREEVVDYLAQTFIALGQEFGRRAFKDFSVNIGIGGVYPLEVRERCLQVDERFLPTTTRVRFTASKRWLQGKVKDTLVLEYPEDLTITEFAVKGGTRNGYQLVPMKEKGKHGMRFFLPGEYQVLLLCQDPLGFERLEQVRVTVEALPEAPKAPAPQPRMGWRRMNRPAPSAAPAAGSPPAAPTTPTTGNTNKSGG